MLTAVKLLFITFWMVVPGFVGMPCDCPHAPMSHEGQDMSAAHMAAMTQNIASPSLTGDECAHKCAAQGAAEQAQIFAAIPSATKLPTLSIAANMLGWQEGALAFSVRAMPARRYFYTPAAPPDKTPVMLKTRLLT